MKVILTGATGYVGEGTLLELLKANQGYSQRTFPKAMMQRSCPKADSGLLPFRQALPVENRIAISMPSLKFFSYRFCY